MLPGTFVKPRHVQGAGDGLLPAEVPLYLGRFLNALLLLAALHFLLQTAIYISCIFLVLPMSFIVSGVMCGANTIMSAASSEDLWTGRHPGQGAGEGVQEKVELPDLQGVEELVLSLAAGYFLLRAGLLFCNLLFILPLLFFLNEISSH